MAIFNRYSKSGLWLLFLTTAFPIHLWTIILVLRDFAWVTERTNAWDAVGVAAYGMVFAFIESLFVFIIVVLLGLLLPKQWDERKRLSFLGLLIFTVVGNHGTAVFPIRFRNSCANYPILCCLQPPVETAVCKLSGTCVHNIDSASPSFYQKR